MDHGTMVVIIDGSKKLIGRSKAHFVDDERIQEWAEVLLEISKMSRTLTDAINVTRHPMN
jgi:hypothetical protein